MAKTRIARKRTVTRRPGPAVSQAVVEPDPPPSTELAMPPPGEVHESVGQLQPADPDPETQAEQELITEIIDNLAFVKSYEQLQRKAEEEEAEFEGLDMWGHDAREARKAHTDEATGAEIPAKATVSVNLLDQTIQQVVSEARQARLALTVKPKTGFALKKTGEYAKGLVRTIQAESGSLSIRLWSLERTAKLGRGGWCIVAEYANDGDFDLDLREKRILDYGTVYWDAYRQRADNSDADWCLVSDWISEKERRRRWPTKPLIASAGAWEADHDWFAVDADTPANRRVRIGVYYKVIHEPYVLGYHPSEGVGWAGKVPAKTKVPTLSPTATAAVLAEAPGTQQREVDVPRVQIYTVDGAQILEQDPWHGKHIPVIETIGKEYFVKGKRRWKGIVANAMELCSAINVLISAATGLAGRMVTDPYIMAMGQDEGLEEMWDALGVKNFTRLYYNSKDVNGMEVGPPVRQQIELQVNGLLLLLRMMHEMYHAVTGSVAPQLRAVNPYDRSGKAIEALQRQGAAGTSNYLDNMATISMLYEGKVLLDAIPHYYDKVGRILYVEGDEEDDDVAIMIKRPFIRDADGMPVAVPCPTCQGQGSMRGPDPFTAPVLCPDCEGSTFATQETMPETWEEKEVEYVDFSEGEFKIVAAVDRDYQTKQSEALAGMDALAKAAPEMVPLYADLWVRAMAFSGSSTIADRIKSRTQPEGDEDLKDIPQHLVGRFMELKQQHAQAMQALQEAQQMLESDAVKAAGQKEIAMIREAVRGKVEQLKLQGKMLEVREGLAAEQQLEGFRGRLESMQQEAQHRHEVMLQTMDERHEIVLQLLKEKGDKEIERHSVGLHDAAAAKADERADLSAAHGDVRAEVSADRAFERDETAGARADARKETMATRADTRAEGAAAKADARADQSAAAADTRAEGIAARQAEREAALAPTPERKEE